MSIQVGEARSLLVAVLILLFSGQSVAGFLQEHTHKKQRSQPVFQSASFMFACPDNQPAMSGNRWRDCAGSSMTRRNDYWSIDIFKIGRIDSTLKYFAAMPSSRRFDKNQSKIVPALAVKKPQVVNARVVEPSVIVLVAIGVVGLVVQRRRQR